MRHRIASLFPLIAMAAIPLSNAAAAPVEVFHADSLAGPMRELKRAFEAGHPGVTINLTSGVSRELAGRIVKGDVCDVFAPSSPAVIDQDLMNKKVAGTDRDAATWYVVFSANEMVVITAKGNPLGIKQVVDLARPDVKFARVTGEKDLATGRTIEFVKRATALGRQARTRAGDRRSRAGRSGETDRRTRRRGGRSRRQSKRRHRLLLGSSRRARGRRRGPVSRERQPERGDPQRGDRSGNGEESRRSACLRRVCALARGAAHPAGHGPAAGRARDSQRRGPGGDPLSASDSRDRQREAAFGGARPGMEVATASAN